ncbi:EF-hand domain-containing protein [Nonomuraea sp. NPDC003804]|uniref:EF-hand domain-containing protein n=1 Tax=Nonomuraea sp. NPDC003804 TaxID=3154547 RepID=UPI0033BEE8F0
MNTEEKAHMSEAREAAKAEFEKFDTDHDGVLTAGEIRQVNQALGGHGVTDEEIEAFVASADRDGDGNITLDEFVALVGGGKHEQR